MELEQVIRKSILKVYLGLESIPLKNQLRLITILILHYKKIGMNSKGYFITGTDTGVGKTAVSAIVAKN